MGDDALRSRSERGPGGATARPDDPITEADVERIARRVVREELDGRDRRGGSVWTLLAGVLVGLFVFVPLSGLFLSSLVDAGVPLPVVSGLGLLATAALIAYAWRLPPFR